MKDIKGNTALVTGASGGIGKDIARILAERGCDLVLVARSRDKLENFKKELLQNFKIEVNLIILDLSTDGAPDELFRQVNDLEKQVDILVNNAGYGIHRYFKDISWEENKNMLSLDLMNLVHITKLFLTGMLERKYGYIMNISSLGAFQPTPSYSTYASAKSFVLNFGIALHYELRKAGVSVTTVCPGVTVTGFQDTAGHSDYTWFMNLTKMKSERVARIAVRKMLRKRSFTVPGIINALSARTVGLMPKKLIAAISSSAMGTPKKSKIEQ